MYAVSSSLPQEKMETFHLRFLGRCERSRTVAQYTPGGGYGTKTGTSQAAAFMTGAYAHEKNFSIPNTRLMNFWRISIIFQSDFQKCHFPLGSDLPNSSQEWISSALQALRMQSELSEKQKPLLTWIDF